MDERTPNSPTPAEVATGGPSCPACGASASADQRFCGQCGAPLSRVCPACGAGNPPAHRFCGQCGAPLTATPRPAPPPEAVPPMSPPPEERRWATVLFADLTGFTAMSERMDPEDVKALADRCADRLSEQVRRFGGTVITVVGDQVGAVFGAPVAHEDDPERAVRAALAMLDCPLADDPEQRIPLHIGIYTGEVAVGLVGPPEHRLYTAMGDPVNTASRLVSAALPGTIVVGEETYRATRRAVRYRALPPVTARGKERPVAAWEVLELLPEPEGRPLGAVPLLGRDLELAKLSGIWAKVTQEEQPHLVTVVGEPGIGKSRLVAEFERRALSEAMVLHGRCLPHGEALGYRALAAALKEAAGITAADDAQGARRKLGDLVVAVAGLSEDVDPEVMARHLALAGGLDTPEDRGAPPDPRALQASIRRFLEALARQRPLCLMVEDIHWADDALLDLLEFVAARAQNASLLILTQARPELAEKRPAWGRGVREFATLSLEPLAEEAARELTRALCRERGLEEGTAEQVGRGAGGNPLFAEELVAMVAERGGAAGIPGVIKALISARLDALPAEQRRVLQWASVFGKTFWSGGVQALGAREDTAWLLEALEARDLLRPQGQSQFPGEAEYAFKHDLIRDVAYETLPRAERRRLHGGVADWLVAAGGEGATAQYDLLAHHSLLAEQEERGLEYLVRAAERAGQAAAHRQETALLARAIEIAERLGRHEQVAELRARRGQAFVRLAMWREARPEIEAALADLPMEQRGRRAELLVDLARASHWVMDMASTRRHAEEAEPLARETGQASVVAEALTWIATADIADGKFAIALEGWDRVLAECDALGTAPPIHLMSFYSLGLYWTAQFHEAVERAREGVRLARAAHDTEGLLMALSCHGLALGGAGRYGEAWGVFQEGRQFGREYGVGGSLARCIAMAGGLRLDLGDFAGAEAFAEEARDVARASGAPGPSTSAGIDLLLNLARRQEVGRTEGLLDEVAALVAKTVGAHEYIWKPRLAEARAEIALAREEWEEALRHAEETIALSRPIQRVKYLVAGLGTRGQALAAMGRTREAIVDLRAAVDLARPTGDPSMLLRATTALLSVEGDDDTAAEALGAGERILAALPEGELRQGFLASEPARLLGATT